MTFWTPKTIVPFRLQQRYPKSSKNVFICKLQLTLKKSLLAPLQFGFRKKVSVEDALLFFSESVQQVIQDGKIVHAVLLDLSKAFDSLSHEICLSKLKSLGFSSSAINFIKSFLSDRLQQVSNRIG